MDKTRAGRHGLGQIPRQFKRPCEFARAARSEYCHPIARQRQLVDKTMSRADGCDERAPVAQSLLVVGPLRQTQAPLMGDN